MDLSNPRLQRNVNFNPNQQTSQAGATASSSQIGALRPWNQSRDYRGFRFQDYLDPSFYEPVGQGQRFTFRDYLDLESNNRVFVINQPNPRRTDEFSRSQISEGLQSPQFPRGIYSKRARADQFYWVGNKQIAQQFQLVSIDQLQVEQLTQNEELTLFQQLLIFISEQLPGLADLFGFDNETNLGRLLNTVVDRLDYSNAIAVWVPTLVITEDLQAVAGNQPTQSLLDALGLDPSTLEPRSDVGTSKSNMERSFLPFLVSGFGLATGNPILIGSGFVLRYLESVRGNQ